MSDIIGGWGITPLYDFSANLSSLYPEIVDKLSGLSLTLCVYFFVCILGPSSKLDIQIFLCLITAYKTGTGNHTIYIAGGYQC